jgi:peroxiredoxin
MGTRRLFIAVFALVCMEMAPAARVAPPQASSGRAPVDIETLGPQVGSRVPDFTLVDQQGQSRSLASLMGPRGLMLVFYRSADWCALCKQQLADLQSRAADLRQHGLGLAAVSRDPVTVLAELSKRRSITFPLLSDSGSATIKRYGIFNTAVPPNNPQMYGIPFPGTFIVNPQGIVTERFFEPTYQERTTVASILVQLGRTVDVPATKVSSAQIDISTFTSDLAVAPGEHFSLVLDIRPSTGAHVYAPGVKDYTPIALSLQPRAGLIVGKAQYPQSELYHFEPLDEYVPVFQRPFRIVQDVAIEATATQRLTIKGKLTYQACNDNLCFIAQAVPLSWTVAVKAPDVARSQP